MRTYMTQEEYLLFSSVARYRNFSKAAQELYMSQPALSRRIAQLEKDLNIALFERTHQGVSLTQGGKYILDQYKWLEESFQSMLHEAQQYNDGNQGLLNIGVQDGHKFDKDSMRFIRIFLEKNPLINLNIHCLSHFDLLTYIRQGIIDIGFINNFDSFELDDFGKMVTCRAQGQIVLSCNHRLASLDHFDTYDLFNDETLIVTDMSVAKGALKFIQAICQELNIFPKETKLVPSHSTMMLWTSIGMGFCITCENAWFGHPKLKFIPLPENASCNQLILWNESAMTPTCICFVDEYKEFKQTCNLP